MGEIGFLIGIHCQSVCNLQRVGGKVGKSLIADGLMEQYKVCWNSVHSSNTSVERPVVCDEACQDKNSDIARTMEPFVAKCTCPEVIA